MGSGNASQNPEPETYTLHSASEGGHNPAPHPNPPSPKSNLEKYIGENLANKIGIIITILGVAIGAKYAIDHQLISRLARINSGYLFGLGLLVFALKLRKNYTNFSSVLLSGSMAILYFITYSAYTLYGLIPQVPAFALMVVFTVFTVAVASVTCRWLLWPWQL